MDLNALLFHHQIALIRKPDERYHRQFGSRFDLVEHYERRISELRLKMGVTQYPIWMKVPSAAVL